MKIYASITNARVLSILPNTESKINARLNTDVLIESRLIQLAYKLELNISSVKLAINIKIIAINEYNLISLANCFLYRSINVEKVVEFLRLDVINITNLM